MTKLCTAYFSVFKTSRASLFSVGILALLLNFTPARAADYIWNGVVSNDWNNAANWTPRGVPGASDSATVIADKTVNTDIPVRVGRLILAVGSSLQGAGDVTVVSGATFTDVKLSGSGLLNIEPGAIVDLNSVGRNNGVISNLLSTVLNTVLNLLISKGVVNRGLIRWNAGNLQLGADMTNEGSFDVRSSGSLSQSALLATTFTNKGSFIQSGVNSVTWSPGFKNQGTVRLTAGTLDLRGDAIQTAGLTKFEGGSLKSTKPFLLQGGKWGGSGAFTGTLRNEGGVLAPGFSPGSIVINGSYIQAANGTLQAEIGGTTPGSGYDQLVVNGPATLGGTLDLTQYAGFVPAPGNSFELMRYFSVSGDFATVLNRFTNPGTYFTTSKTPGFLLAQANADAALPTITIANPRLNQAGASVPSANGTASDALSGVANVSVRLYRYAGAGVTAGFWNGVSWDAAYNALTHERPATGTTNWSWNLPALAEGKYYVIATVKDKANNTASTATIIFWIDTIIPATATITSPAHNTNAANLNAVSGTATDAGSGITRVDLRIKRLSDNLYWNGTTWAVAVTNLTTTLAGSNWSRTNSANTPMPTGASLPNGLYTLTAYAYDRANLNRAAVSTVNVTAVPALQYEIEAASTHLVSAQWNAGNLQLTFSAPLDVASLPEAQFALSLNGAPLQAQSVTGNSSMVVISVPASSQPPNGATITVSWSNLHDAGGASLSGQTSLVAS